LEVCWVKANPMNSSSDIYLLISKFTHHPANKTSVASVVSVHVWKGIGSI